jgi:hypothetical protein
MTLTPNVVNTLEKQGRGQEWATGLISVGHEAPVAVSGSNMGQGQPTGKVLSFEQSAPILRTKNPDFEEVFYFEPLSENMKWFMCCTCCCWSSMLRPRSYYKVTESAVETNIPVLVNCFCPFDCFVVDFISKAYYDKFGTPFHSTMCSPYHLCCCISCFGDVMGVAPHPSCANIFCQCLFPCLFRFFPGLSNAQKAVEAVEAARAARMARGDVTAGSAAGNAFNAGVQ